MQCGIGLSFCRGAGLLLPLLGLCVVGVVFAEPPAKEAKQPPAVPQTLTGADQERVNALQAEIDRRIAKSKFAEAVNPAREIFQIRRRIQGPSHWEVVDADWQVRKIQQWAELPERERSDLWAAATLSAEGAELGGKLRHVEAEPKLRQALAIVRNVLGEEHTTTAMCYNDLAINLGDQGKRAEAEPLYRKALAITRKILGDEHPNTATGYYNLAANVSTQGKYAEAEPLYNKALAIRRKVLGEEHPDTANSYGVVAYTLDQLDRYDDAEALHNKALAIRRKVLGEEHPDTANSYDNLGSNLENQGRYADAERLKRTALTIRRTALGDEHLKTAVSYNNLGFNLDAQGNYAAAEPFLRKGLEIRRRILGEAHPRTATSYNNLASNLGNQGRHAAAELLERTALEIRRKFFGEEHPDTASSYNNLAVNLSEQGKHAAAEPLLRKALEVRRKTLGELHSNTATAYGNLGFNLSEQGKHAAAEPPLRKALEVRRKALGDEHPDVALSYSNLASNLAAQARYPDAEPLHATALAIRRKVLGESHPDTATSENNLAHNLAVQGRYHEAERYCLRALATRRELLGEQHPDTASSFHSLAWIHIAQGRYAEAETELTSAAHRFESARRSTSHTGLERSRFLAESSPLPRLAALHARRGRGASAWQQLEASLARGLLDDLARPLDVAERRRERDLLGRIHRVDEQIRAVASAARSDENTTQRTEALDSQRNSLMMDLIEFEAGVERKYGAAAGQPYDLPRIQSQIAPDTALITWLDFASQVKAADPAGDHWACIVRSQGDPVWIKLQGRGLDGVWTKDDDGRPTQVAGDFTRRPEGTAPDWTAKAAVLAAQRFDPLERALGPSGTLSPVSHLVVLTSPAMGRIPIEALLEARPSDRPRYTVSYAPSGTLFAWLREKRGADHGSGATPKRLLALGDPLFKSESDTVEPAPPPTHGLLVRLVPPRGGAALAGIRPGDVLLRYDGQKLERETDLNARIADAAAREDAIKVVVWRDGTELEVSVQPGPLGVLLDPAPAPEAIVAQRSADRLLRATQGQAPTSLPGTRQEVDAITRLFDDPVKLLGADASESRLDALATSGALRKFDILHLATHGVLNPGFPMRSALLLSSEEGSDPVSQVLEGRPVFDGELTAEQILRTWKLDAELVTLSACETGRGRLTGGEGYLGFSQALFLAGARSLVLSLWKVDDDATSLLMTRFYENLLGKRAGLSAPLSKAEALAEAKRWLRGLSEGEKSQAVSTQRGAVRPLATTAVTKQLAPVPVRPTGARPFAHPYYWAAFILVGDPG